MTKRRLPLLLERTLGQIAADLARLGEEAQRDALDKGPLSCRPGCSSCCLYPVHVTVAEGVLLYRALGARGRWTASLQARLDDHWRKVGLMAPEVWFLAEIPCPLLEQGKCLGYTARPMVCRTTVTHGLPDLCHPHKVGLGLQVAPQPEHLAEFTTTARRRLKDHGLGSGLIPVSLAVRIGGKLVRGEIDAADVDREVYGAYKALSG